MYCQYDTWVYFVQQRVYGLAFVKCSNHINSSCQCQPRLNPKLRIAKSDQLWLRGFVSIILNPFLRVFAISAFLKVIHAPKTPNFRYPEFFFFKKKFLRIFITWIRNPWHGGVYTPYGKSWLQGGFGGVDDL